MNPEVEAAERALERAREDLPFAGPRGLSAEKRYGAAYQQLVRLGVRPQLRAKYRVYV